MRCVARTQDVCRVKEGAVDPNPSLTTQAHVCGACTCVAPHRWGNERATRVHARAWGCSQACGLHACANAPTHTQRLHALPGARMPVCVCVFCGRGGPLPEHPLLTRCRPCRDAAAAGPAAVPGPHQQQCPCLQQQQQQQQQQQPREWQQALNPVARRSPCRAQPAAPQAPPSPPPPAAAAPPSSL